MAALYWLTNSYVTSLFGKVCQTSDNVGPHLFAVACQDLFGEHSQSSTNNPKGRLDELSINFSNVLVLDNAVDLLKNKFEILLILRCVFTGFETTTVSFVLEVGNDKVELLSPPGLFLRIFANELEECASGKITSILVIVGDHDRAHVVHNVVDGGSFDASVQHRSQEVERNVAVKRLSEIILQFGEKHIDRCVLDRNVTTIPKNNSHHLEDLDLVLPTNHGITKDGNKSRDIARSAQAVMLLQDGPQNIDCETNQLVLLDSRVELLFNFGLLRVVDILNDFVTENHILFLTNDTEDIVHDNCHDEVEAVIQVARGAAGDNSDQNGVHGVGKHVKLVSSGQSTSQLLEKEPKVRRAQIDGYLYQCVSSHVSGLYRLAAEDVTDIGQDTSKLLIHLILRQQLQESDDDDTNRDTGSAVMLPVQRTCEVADGNDRLGTKTVIIDSIDTAEDEVFEKRDEELG
ncbi:hypothetical protein HG531_002220 [Fusarium graminearum]|nr:hypothetical protein HG531_002220 [Fusarium graminearum]